MNIDPKQDPPDKKDQAHCLDVSEILKELKEDITFLQNKEKRYMNDFKLHHKILFAFIVFFAINLVWYGMWDIVSMLPILSNPVVALIVGGIILIGTGYFYENLISASFNKNIRKKKTTEENVAPNPSDQTKNN